MIQANRSPHLAPLPFLSPNVDAHTNDEELLEVCQKELTNHFEQFTYFRILFCCCFFLKKIQNSLHQNQQNCLLHWLSQWLIKILTIVLMVPLILCNKCFSDGKQFVLFLFISSFLRKKNSYEIYVYIVNVHINRICQRL